MLRLETLSPGDPTGGAVYLRIVLSPEEASHFWIFLNMVFLWGGVVSASPNPQAGGPPFVGCPRLLIQYIRSYPPYRRPFLHPQPEDAPCRGDRDLHTHDILHTGHPKKRFGLSRKWWFKWVNDPENTICLLDVLKKDFDEVDKAVFQSVERICEIIFSILA
jgi:hypothetical protein